MKTDMKEELCHHLQHLNPVNCNGDGEDGSLQPNLNFAWGICSLRKYVTANMPPLSLVDIGNISVPITKMDLLKMSMINVDNTFGYSVSPASTKDYENIFKSFGQTAVKQVTSHFYDNEIVVTCRLKSLRIASPEQPMPAMRSAVIHSVNGFFETHGVLFAKLFVQVPIEGGCDGGQLKVALNQMCTGVKTLNTKTGKTYLSCFFFSHSRSEPIWQPLTRGRIAFLEFEMYWKPKVAVTSVPLLPFISAVQSLKSVTHCLKKTNQRLLVLPMYDPNVECKSISFSTLTGYDLDLGILLLSIDDLDVFLALLSPLKENPNYYKVVNEIPLSSLNPYSSVKLAVVHKPKQFVYDFLPHNQSSLSPVFIVKVRSSR